MEKHIQHITILRLKLINILSQAECLETKEEFIKFKNLLKELAELSIANNEYYDASDSKDFNFYLKKAKDKIKEL